MYPCERPGADGASGHQAEEVSCKRAGLRESQGNEAGAPDETGLVTYLWASPFFQDNKSLNFLIILGCILGITCSPKYSDRCTRSHFPPEAEKFKFTSPARTFFPSSRPARLGSTWATRQRDSRSRSPSATCPLLHALSQPMNAASRPDTLPRVPGPSLIPLSLSGDLCPIPSRSMGHQTLLLVPSNSS